MNTGPVVDFCANCGAPLDLDEANACRWCHARIRTERAAVPASRTLDEVDPEPEDLDEFDLAPELVPWEVNGGDWMTSFLRLIFTTLQMLSHKPAVKEYMHREPRLLQQIQALSTAVSAAGVRVYDAGLLKDYFDGNLAVYTPEEIWTFDLAFDVIALIGALDGLPRQARDSVAKSMQVFDKKAHDKTWKKAMKNASEGPVALRELRAQVPHRA